MPRFHKIWHDPVWSKVIAGIVLGGGALALTYLLNLLWPSIGEYVHAIYRFALAATALPNWTIGLLGLLALPVIVLVFGSLWQKGFPAKPEPEWMNYRTDEFFNLNIRWRWDYRSSGIHNLSAFCPYCDFQIYAQEEGWDRIVFDCEKCGQKLHH
jgi:hypothetical protein